MRAAARAALGAAALLIALGACACERSDDPAEQGRRVYAANCTACHHVDPGLEGPLGPPIAGSSTALLEARVIRAEYPAGYQPKRDSELMVPLPYLGSEIDVLAAYLASIPCR